VAELLTPNLDGTAKMRQFINSTQEGARELATSWSSLADICAMDWDALPIDRGRFGPSPGKRAARQLHYMSRLMWRTHDAAGLLWADYNALIVNPMNARQARPKWNVNG
jgi:hypothetical protein